MEFVKGGNNNANDAKEFVKGPSADDLKGSFVKGGGGAEVVNLNFHYIGERYVSFEMIVVSDAPLPAEFDLHVVTIMSKKGLFSERKFTYDGTHKVTVPDSDFGFKIPITSKTKDGRIQTVCLIQLGPDDGVNGIKLGKYEAMVGVNGGPLTKDYTCNLSCKITPSKTEW